MFKKTESLDTLLTEAKTLDEGKDQVYYKLPDISEWDSTNISDFKLTLGGTAFSLTDHALKQFLKKLKIPYPYFAACSSDLRDKEIKEALEDANNKVEYIFKTKGTSIYGIIPKQYYNILTAPFIQKIASNLPGDIKISEFSLTDTYTRARFISTDKSFIAVDEIVPGVDVQFSEVGFCPFQITSALFRKVCSNGLMLPDGQAVAFKMPMARFKDAQFSAAVSSVSENFNEQSTYASMLENFKTIALSTPDTAAQEELPADFEAAFKWVVPSTALRKDYKQFILQEFIDDKENHTLNGIVNAVTRTARDIETQDKDRLELSAGTFISKVNSFAKDASEHGETLELSFANLTRLMKRHK